MQKNKKIRSLSLLAFGSIIPVVSAPILVSCENIDYQKDVNFQFKKDKSTLLASEVQDNLSLLSTSGKVKYNFKVEKTDDNEGTIQLVITPFHKNKNQPSFTLKVSGFKKLEKIEEQNNLKDLLDKITNIDLKDKAGKTLNQYKTEHPDLKPQLISSDDFGTETPSIQNYLDKNEINTQLKLTAKPSDNTKANLEIVFTKDKTSITKNYLIDGFTKEVGLQEFVDRLQDLSLEGTKDKSISAYLKENTDLISKLKSSSTTISNVKEFLEKEKINVQIYLMPIDNDSKSANLNIKFAKGTETVEKTYMLKDVFVADVFSEVFDGILKEVSLEDAETYDGVEYKEKFTDLKEKLLANGKTKEELKEELKKKQVSLKDVLVEAENLSDGIYKVIIVLEKIGSGETQYRTRTGTNHFKNIKINNITNKFKDFKLEIKENNLTVKHWMTKYGDKELKDILSNYLEYANKFYDYDISLKKEKIVPYEQEKKIVLTIKFESSKFKTSVFTKEFAFEGFKEPESDPKTPKEAAEKGLLIVPETNDSQYQTSLETIKNWWNKNKKPGLIYPSNGGEWSIRPNVQTTPDYFGALKFNDFGNGWKFSDLIRLDTENNKKYAHMYFETSSNNEISKITIKFKLVDNGDTIYEVVYWTKQ
ncbi:lipoprotein 17-related variable surface protein [Metamycoplasma hyosynoviae]|uniref:lipoprotein 17-related variable surface protein n=1 Tax=Metamycoplasma hyosynoviae TaxID=29559 RepID=UPI0023584A2F|nr:lipoprotein 17-related variable surface protein [Metamycoplasma hyosynoviae]MDC8900796.1 lipoprotein 17-related variable surface protein [Metamycoplasma hyosynoviae]MDC8912311.1 lipoprotein 17-related variable surface protein [Metamycoplasma hyosynoviae]MDC8914805.1 lipoprotein 17-related variable surface protein [Metamycoplasma hyosynoviae]MDC8917453.1 lipoprotein 17-related variable surface protein [Metamycoplasma hyosynoviae]MDC8918868.1 lipoprotein 17-related variable surface protein [M